MQAEIEALAGDDAAGEQQARAAVETFERIGEKPRLAMAAAVLSRILADRGRDAEAERFLVLAEEAMFADDMFVAIEVAIARAKVHARRGALAEAEEAARDAVRLARSTDAPIHTGDALTTLADVLRSSGRIDEAASLSEEAARVFDRKGYTVRAETARRAARELEGRPRVRA